jgi:hypothetical protein
MPVSEETDEYGNYHVNVGVGMSLKGVHFLFDKDEKTGEYQTCVTFDPEFARRIAMNLTIASYQCEDERRKSSGG